VCTPTARRRARSTEPSSCLSDIDAAKRVQSLLQSARTYAESIVDSVRHPLVVLDLDLRIESANLAFCQTYALDQARIRGRGIVDIVRGDGVDLEEQLRHVTRSGTVLENLELRQSFESVGIRAPCCSMRGV
jgi:two-component system CheB/CheR fusion protein